MKKISLFIFLLQSILSFAQNNIGTTYCNHNDLNASKYQPSELDLGNKHLQIGFNYYLWMGNNSIDYKTIHGIYNSGAIENSEIDNVLSKVKKKNILGVGQDYQVLGIGFQIKNKNDKKFDFAVSLVDKFALNFNYTDNFLKFAFKGNKQFAGQRTALGPLTANANYLREYAVCSAFPLIGNEKDGGIRLGVRAKFIQGLGVLYMPKGDAYITTDAQGKYINMEFDYSLYTSGLNNFNLFKYNGTGIGVDVGATFFLTKNIEFVASVLDIGSVKYHNNTTLYEGKGNAHYEGLVVDNLLGGSNEFSDDTLGRVFNPKITKGKNFTMPLGTKICFEGEIKTPRLSTRDDAEYVSNAIFFTYIQGLRNLPGATTRPFMSIGYNHDFHRVFDGGFSGSVGGYNKVAFGAFFSFKFGQTVKWGFSSDNLTAFILPNYGTGIDFSTNFSLSF